MTPHARAIEHRRVRARARVTCTGTIALLACFLGLAEARRDRTVTGDVIKAARFLTTSRIDDAKILLADLKKRAPDTAEVLWLDGPGALTQDFARLPYVKVERPIWPLDPEPF